MAEHLPECMYDTQLICICYRLRACEARVEAKHRAIHDATRAAQRFDYEQGRSDALDAARDAVAALSPHECYRSDMTCVLHSTALAAIDALRATP